MTDLSATMMMDIEEAIKEYKFDFDDIFNEYDERLKPFNTLSEPDRLLLIMYAEIGSFRDLGKMLGVSRTAVWKKIQQIRKKFE